MVSLPTRSDHSVRRLPRKAWLPPSDPSSDRTNRIGLGLYVQRAGTRDKSQPLGRQASGPGRRSCSGSDDPLHCERSPDIPSVRYRFSHPEAGGPSVLGSRRGRGALDSVDEAP